ncbi:aminotransferase class I/II-fold pyridoxal phosphate-dependent enzyme [Betaproteobacteria bacterium LSUCC0117]|nr:aminotransferase class I/II-fold pyridoxal phosphate-dependent enzyme [Betaproteobacteria bacterium LSUCC0117]
MNKIIAVVTDGDIRRALIAGSTMSDSVMCAANQTFISVKESDSIEESIIAAAKGLNFIPKVSSSGELIDVISIKRETTFPISNIFFKGNEIQYVNDCLRSGWISSQGKYVKAFEENFAEWVGSRHALAVSNGTVAIQLALVACGIKPGDRVIVPDFTFAATINAVLAVGAVPVIVPVEEVSLGIDTDALDLNILNQASAMIAVHIYGMPCNIIALEKICKRHNIVLIEDCAEALGTKVEGRHVGTFGHAATFSFFGNKTITTGEGGMIIFNESIAYDLASILRDHGMSKEKKYIHLYAGYNYRMTNIQAAIGVAQLENIEYYIEQKIRIAHLYNKFLSGESRDIQLPIDRTCERNSHWLYALRLRGGLVEKRDEIIDILQRIGVQSRPYFFPLCKMDPYKAYSLDSLEYSTENISLSGLCLPTYPQLEENEIEYIARNLLGAIATVKGR